VKIPEQVEVRVWDSSAEQRYIVVPQRPSGSDNMSEEALASLVTRDSMIGAAIIEPVSRKGTSR
jgi:nitrile hydratase subunit alpha